MQAVKPAALILMPLEFLGVPGILSTPWGYPFVVSGRQYSNVLHLPDEVFKRRSSAQITSGEMGSRLTQIDLGVGRLGALLSDEFDRLHGVEKAALESVLNRSRVLAAKIANELRNKKPEHFVDEFSLADIYYSLEHVACGPQADCR